MIADALNCDKVPTKNGGKWYARTVKNILENSLYRKAFDARVDDESSEQVIAVSA